MELIKRLKERYKGWKEQRFLESYGCTTWREYERRYDPDIGTHARWSHTFYHGYPHVLPIESNGFARYGLQYHNLVEKMMEWCEQNCRGKWRNDWHRGNWDHGGNYEFNGISGGDVMFFAFKEDSDYVWFKLAWG